MSSTSGLLRILLASIERRLLGLLLCLIALCIAPWYRLTKKIFGLLLRTCCLKMALMRIWLGMFSICQEGSDYADFHCSHIHWYERLFPLGVNSTIDTASIINNNTYYTNPGVSMTHLINGMAGNIESHSTLTGGVLNITAVLDQTHYGFSKLTVLNATALKWTFVRGDGGIIGDELLLLKKPGKSGGGNSTSSSVGSGNSTSTSAGPTPSTYVTTQVVSEYTTYCPYATTFTQGSSTYTVTSVSSSATYANQDES